MRRKADRRGVWKGASRTVPTVCPPLSWNPSKRNLVTLEMVPVEILNFTVSTEYSLAYQEVKFQFQ